MKRSLALMLAIAGFALLSLTRTGGAQSNSSSSSGMGGCCGSQASPTTTTPAPGNNVPQRPLPGAVPPQATQSISTTTSQGQQPSR